MDVFMPFPEDETRDPGGVTVFSSFAGNRYSFGALFFYVILVDPKIAFRQFTTVSLLL